MWCLSWSICSQALSWVACFLPDFNNYVFCFLFVLCPGLTAGFLSFYCKWIIMIFLSYLCCINQGCYYYCDDVKMAWCFPHIVTCSLLRWVKLILIYILNNRHFLLIGKNGPFKLALVLDAAAYLFRLVNTSQMSLHLKYSDNTWYRKHKGSFFPLQQDWKRLWMLKTSVCDVGGNTGHCQASQMKHVV